MAGGASSSSPGAAAPSSSSCRSSLPGTPSNLFPPLTSAARERRASCSAVSDHESSAAAAPWIGRSVGAAASAAAADHSKAEEVSLVLSEPDVDLWRLRELALTEGGLVNDALRKRAWPKLVGLHAHDNCGAGSKVHSDPPGQRSKGGGGGGGGRKNRSRSRGRDGSGSGSRSRKSGKTPDLAFETAATATAVAGEPTEAEGGTLKSAGGGSSGFLSAGPDTSSAARGSGDVVGVGPGGAAKGAGGRADNERDGGGADADADVDVDPDGSPGSPGRSIALGNWVDDDKDVGGGGNAIDGGGGGGAGGRDKGDGEPMIEVVDASEVLSTPHSQRKTAIVARCLDAEQIERDIARCTWHLLTGGQRSRHRQMKYRNRRRMQGLLRRKQRRLGNLINLVLIRSYDDGARDDGMNADGGDGGKLRYYQGFHDVSCIFLNALGGGAGAPTGSSEGGGAGAGGLGVPCRSEAGRAAAATAGAMGLDLPARVLLQVSRSHLRDAMRSDFHQLTSALRLVVLPLIGALDPEVHSRLYEVDMEPFFAISWIITWFAHDIRDTALVKRLYDAFLASHPLMPIYVSVAMVLHPVNRLEVLGAEPDFAAVHCALANLPKNSCSVGWRWTERGYVSGDEEEDGGPENGGAAASAGDSQSGPDTSFVSDELSSILGDASAAVNRDDDTHSLASTLVLSTPGCNDAKVPFQDLIDMSISFMRRIPPRNLLPLARRYFADQNARPLLLAESSTIALLQPPPSWGLASRAPSDWVLKQRARRNNLLSSSRSARRRRSRSRNRSRTPVRNRKARPDRGERVGKESDSGKAVEIGSMLGGIVNMGELSKGFGCESRSFIALIASGMGPAGEDEERARRRRRKRIIVGSVAVAVVSIAVGLVQTGALDYLFGLASKGGHVLSSSAQSEEASTDPEADAGQCQYDSFHADVIGEKDCIGPPRKSRGSGPPIWGKIMKSSHGFIKLIQRAGQKLDRGGRRQVKAGGRLISITREEMAMGEL